MTTKEPAIPRRAVVMTALGVEFKAVRAHLKNVREETDPQGTIYETGEFTGHDGTVWRVSVVETGPGNPSAAAQTERAINYCKPRVVVFVGIAGGMKDVSIGDVVAATRIYGYESGKAKQRFETRPEVYLSTYDMQQRARAEARREDWLTQIQTSKKGKFKAFVGPIASGEKVVASRKTPLYAFIRSHYGDAIAVEMEGLGFLLAAAENRGVSALVVRGISDLLEQKARADAAGSQRLAADHASAFAFQVLSRLNFNLPEDSASAPAPEKSAEFARDAYIDGLIGNVRHGDLKSGAKPALELIKHTDKDGRNELFEKLLDYLDHPDDDLFWKALGTLESCSEVAPWLFVRPVLVRLASHSDFSVRSTAAFICLNLAQHAPELVPVDILMKLSVHDEDWYVEAPANAALKSMVRAMPAVLQVFFTRLHSSDPDERVHSAAALADIAGNEPELLDATQLREEFMRLLALGDNSASIYLKRALPKVEHSRRRQGYKYSI